MSQWLYESMASLDERMRAAALQRQQELTKPRGSLGLLEALAVTLAAMQGTQRPRLDRVHVTVFAADHGVVAEGVSAYPQAVTAEMVRNFARGGAAICVLARALAAHLEVVNAGTVSELEPLPGVLDQRVAAGTRNLAAESAMDMPQLESALALGKSAAERAQGEAAQLLIGAEMGIGNTTSAAAVGCALLDCSATELAGPGTGLDALGVAHKAEVISRALRRVATRAPKSVLAELGGFEIAALAGLYLRGGQLGIPCLVDGFIATVAALAAVRLQPLVRPWLLFGHRSAEPGHGRVLAALEAEPLLALEMRLGEGSGAALAVPLLRAAAALHGEMATFGEASVTDAMDR